MYKLTPLFGVQLRISLKAHFASVINTYDYLWSQNTLWINLHAFLHNNIIANNRFFHCDIVFNVNIIPNAHIFKNDSITWYKKRETVKVSRSWEFMYQTISTFYNVFHVNRVYTSLQLALSLTIRILIENIVGRNRQDWIICSHMFSGSFWHIFCIICTERQKWFVCHHGAYTTCACISLNCTQKPALRLVSQHKISKRNHGQDKTPNRKVTQLYQALYQIQYTW